MKITDSLRSMGASDVNPFPGPHTMVPIQAIFSDVIVGQSGQTIKQIFQKTGCYIFVPRDEIGGERILQISGSPDTVDRCRIELFATV